jgi:hypothetical protein
MANKQGGLLVTLGKRILGFSTSSSGCCAAPAAETVKIPAAKSPEARVVEVAAPDTTAQDASCCAPSCCASTTPANARS